MSDLQQASASFSAYAGTCQTRVGAALELYLGKPGSEFDAAAVAWLAPLFGAMRYSLVNGGKRVRPMLVYAAAEAVGSAPSPTLDAVACAVEYIHAYSLVHDDLPAMDDDDLRRGVPTCHRAFGEAAAILAGDALQARAFELLTELTELEPARRLRLVACLAAAAGARGMVGGQAIDIAAVREHVELPRLQSMHRLKTGALIRAAINMGALAAGADPASLQRLDHYGEALGLCFQVQDDILDVTAATEVLGKRAGADADRGKPTYPALMGLQAARDHAAALHADAIAALADFGPDALRLRQLADYVLERPN